MPSAWGLSWGSSWGVSWGDAFAAAPEAPSIVPRGAPRTGGWNPQRFYLPPVATKKRKQKVIKAVRELYEEARETIPKPLQAGPLPAAFTRGGRGVSALPSMSRVDFEALSRSLETIQLLAAAIEEQRAIQRRRRKEEETLLMLLMDMP